MCEDCWKTKYNSTTKLPENNEMVDRSIELIKRIYDISCVGGNCHIVLDDWNLGASHVEYCLNQSLKEEYWNDSNTDLEAERELMRLFLQMTEEQRAAVLAKSDGYF